MYSKLIYTIVGIVSVGVLGTVILRLKPGRGDCVHWLSKLLIGAGTAVLANICIALAGTPLVAKIGYGIYFAAIDWIAYFLAGLFLEYARFEKFFRIIRWPVYALMMADSLSMALNLGFGHVYSIYSIMDVDGVIFYLTKFTPIYTIHLVLDYLVIAIGLAGIIIRICKSYGYYRTNYVAILAVLILVLALNVIYMAFTLTLDWSVLTYALAGVLLYFNIIKFIPERMMNGTMRQAVNKMNEGLILFDIDDRCLYCNRFMENNFGASPTETTYELSILYSVLEGERPERLEPKITEYVQPGRNGGDNSYYKVHFDRLEDRKGRYLGAYFLIEDISALRRNMIELEEARKEADKANVAKSNFLANMSHEIRTPINSVLGMNEMILRESKNAQILEYAQNISSAGNSLLGLINDILDFSKIEAGKMTIVETQYSLHNVLRDCHQMLFTRAQEKGIALEFVVDGKIPSEFYGDENRVRQILSNLITNGIKYTKAGKVTVRIDYEEKTADLVNLLIRVEDTGVGIAEENLEKIFIDFQRVDQEKNRNIEGTGLGLAITRQLVSLMNGQIQVTSTLGEGSCFSVILPQKVTDVTPAGEFSPNPVKKETHYQESFTAPEARILVVDDVPMNLKVVSALLKKTAIKVELAKSGLDAVEKCRGIQYDVIFMDHMMPAPDGVAAFHMLREDGLNKETPVVVLTANAINGAEEEYRKIGFTDYLSKPVRGEELEKMLIRLLPEEKVKLR